MYHRQIYKHALSTRILNDPRQKRYVASRDLRDLFSLTDTHHAGGTETNSIFRGIGEQVTAADVREAEPDEADAGGEAAGERAAQRAAKPAPAHADAADGGDAGGGDDAGILRELFSGSGLHPALNHSAIEGASDPAKLDAEQQAARVAERAAAALRASRAAVRAEPVHMCGLARPLPLPKPAVALRAAGTVDLSVPAHVDRRGRVARATRAPRGVLAMHGAPQQRRRPGLRALHSRPRDLEVLHRAVQQASHQALQRRRHR